MITIIAIILIVLGAGLLILQTEYQPSKSVLTSAPDIKGETNCIKTLVFDKLDTPVTTCGLTITHTGSDTVEYTEPVDGAVGATYEHFLLELNGKKKEIGFSSGPQKNSVQWEGYVVTMNDDGSITVQKI